MGEKDQIEQGDQGDLNERGSNERGNQDSNKEDLNLNGSIESEGQEKVLNCMHWNMNGESGSRYLLDT